MKNRFVIPVGVALVAISLLQPGLVSAQAASGTAGTAAAESGPFVTPWGEPDLQGIWSDEVQVPLERPKEYANREFLTDQERIELDKIRQENIRTNLRASPEFRRDRGTELDVANAYNNVFHSYRPTGRRTSLIVDPKDGRIPPLTPEAQKRQAARREYLAALLQGTSGGKPGPPSPRRTEPPPFYNVDRINRADGPEDRSLMERCMGGSLPDFSGFYRFVQSPGYVAIYHDTGQGQGFSRIVPITDRPALTPRVRNWWGDARGRWEGQTLVVETTNFHSRVDYRGSRENLRLVERFTRVNADTVEYELTISDPTTWTRPWTIKLDFTKQDDFHNRVFEPGCHEGNFGLTGMLINTRAAERAFAEGRGPDPATMDTATGNQAGSGGTPID